MSPGLIFSAFAAGVLTIFSPCILPMIPFVVRSSFQRSKWGPVLLSLGLALSFSISTFIIATSGQLLGLTPENLKTLSGIFLLLASLLFLFPGLIDRISNLLSPINNRINKFSNTNPFKQKSIFIEFLNGLFLGPLWTPCSGPTLAIIIGIIINTPEVKSSILLLAIFSIGSILPILFISYGAKSLVEKLQKKTLENSKNIKLVLGIFCAVMSILILTGLDKKLESIILSILPEAITNLSLII